MTDAELVLRARGGEAAAFSRLIEHHGKFIRFKARSYFLPGGDPEDLVAEGFVGLHKAIRDYRTDRESSFRNFAELCITRQIITAVKTATRNKHTPLNQYVSFSQTPAAAGDSDTTLDEILPGPLRDQPVEQLCAQEDWGVLQDAMGRLTFIERASIEGIAGDETYQEIARRCRCAPKTVDNAAQRARGKLASALELAAA